MGASGVLIETVRRGSPAHKAGLRKGDTLLKVDGQPIRDTIDYLYCLEGPEAGLEVMRGGRRLRMLLELEEGMDAGLGLEHFKVRTCGNDCVFCFVSQLPKGLRRPLYVKDEDYRMSFLYGNYVTLTGLKDSDRKRIIDQRLSPLYVSVHSTDPELRARLLGRKKAPDIIEELRFFASHNIKVHAQIVLCPDLNDKRELERTLKDLTSLYPSVMSVAVVPVGLTEHHRRGIRPLEREDAALALDIVDRFAGRMMREHGEAVVYSADELYLKARRAFPRLSHYADLPQYENGVGMVPLFRAEAARIRPKKVRGGKRYLTFTGTSFYPSLARFIDKLTRSGIKIKAVPVVNRLFGESVTVTGLLAGRDVLEALVPYAADSEVLIVPDVVLRDGDGLFLDNMSVKELGKKLKIKTEVIEPGPPGLYEAVSG